MSLNLCKFQVTLSLLVITIPALQPHLTVEGHSQCRAPLQREEQGGESQGYGVVAGAKTLHIWLWTLTYLHCKNPTRYSSRGSDGKRGDNSPVSFLVSRTVGGRANCSWGYRFMSKIQKAEKPRTVLQLLELALYPAPSPAQNRVRRCKNTEFFTEC